MVVGKLTLAALGLALVVLVVAVAAQEAGEERFILGARDMEPPLNEWRALNRKPPAMDIVRFNVALRQRNVDVLEAALYEVSDPRSPKYGQHLTSEEILDIVAPAKEDHDVVVEWLHNSGVVSIESARDALKVQATVAQVEQLLQTELYLYQHKGTKGLKIALVGEYSIPAHLTPQIALVTGFTEFPRRVDSNRRSHKQRLGASPGDSPYYFVPQVITNLYGVPDENVVINNAGVTQGVVEFEDVGAFMEGDLAQFFDGIDLPDYNKTVIVGPYAPNGFLESELDIQYIMGIAQNATTYYWTQQGWMYDFALDAFTRKDIPLVFSMSYGWTERSECSLGPGYPVDNCTRSDDYVNRTNVEFMKLGARGVTLLAASGDQGAPGDGNPECINIFDPLNPLYPAASPYVLSVGATMLDPETGTTQPPKICQQFPCATGGTEVTCAHPVALITSGGGFSVYTPRPSYQDAVIQAYENSDIKKPPSLLYHKDNRGIPDVAGFGHSYLIVSAYQWEIVDGTSCSTPMWGAIVSILNNIRLNQGKSPLGFINPLLYQIYADTNGAAFNDITSGDNKCTEELCCLFGFDAGAGWDPVTGLGSPNVKALIDYVTNMTN